jgi:hypothetical protein
MTRTRASTTLLVGAILIAGLSGFLSACSGGTDGATTEDTVAATTTIPALAYPTYADPQIPISVGLSRRFAIVLPSDPESGWRWIIEPVDLALLAPLGSEFSEDPKLLASIPATTTTTVTTVMAMVTTTTTAGDNPASTTTTMVPAPLVQVISFAARGLGPTFVRFRYERIGASGADPATGTDPSQATTFAVVIVPDVEVPGTAPSSIVP